LRLLDQGPDLVLTDLAMPDMSGWQVVQQIKARHPHLPVVLLTGSVDGDDPSEEDRSGVDRILRKPARLQEILTAIADLTARPPHADATRN